MTILLRVVMTLLAALSFGSQPLAQGAWSTHFDMPGFGIAGRVFALGTWRNELIAGTYQTPMRDGNMLNHLGRFDGVRWAPIGGGVNGRVRAVLDFQGDLVVGGLFGLAGGTQALGIARWNGSQWAPFGAGLSGEVWALCQHQGQLYAAGDFNVSGSTPIRSLARWTGSQWAEVGGGLRRTLWASTTGRTLLSDGNLLWVGGDFDQAGTTPAGLLAAWNGTSWQTAGSGLVGSMMWSLAKWNGRLYAGGLFAQAGSVLADNIAAWDGSQWHAVGAGVQDSIYGAVVHTLGVYNNALYVGGSFDLSGATTLRRIARFDGTQLQPIGGVSFAEVNPATLFAMTAWNGRLYCGGEFQLAGQIGTPTQTIGAFHLAAYDGAAWSSVGDGLGFNNEVHVLGRWQGQAIAGGRFQSAGGNAAYGLARFDGDDWRYLAAFDGLVTGMTEHNGELWVAGEFYTVNGIAANGVARFDGTTWSAVGGGPGPMRANCIASYLGMIHIGSMGAPQRWTGAGWQPFAPTINGILTAMHVHQGMLYIGGATSGGPRLHAWDGTTATPIFGLNDSVEALGSYNGELIVGGRFTQAGGLPARAIARWDGTSWSTFGIGIQGATVQAITTFQGELVIGGDFNTQQGAPANYVARWTGAGWAPFSSSQPNGTIFALLTDDARGELLAGGWYFRIGTNNDVGYLCAWEATPYWTNVGTALGNPRRSPRLAGDGRLLTGARTRWRLSSAEENSLGVLVLGTSALNQPLLGGTLVPSVDATALVLTDGIGTSTFTIAWPGNLPGFQAWAQTWLLDATGPQGLTATNGVWLRAP